MAWAQERDRDDRIEARPFQEEGVPERAGVTREQARRAAWLVAPDGRRWGGARAAGRVLTLLPGWKLVGRLLLLPGIRWLASLAYRWIADHRGLTSRLTGIGRSSDTTGARSDDPAASRSDDPAATRSDDPAAGRSDNPAAGRSSDPSATRS